MLNKPFTYLNISDIHLFHRTNPTEYICGSIAEYFDDFSDRSRFTKLDMIAIGGDITDDRVDFKSPTVFQFFDIFNRLMKFCVKHEITLRILRGTPNHEYDQSRNLIPMAESFGEALDFRYVDTLYIEHLDKWGIDMLYVPDEWAGSAQKCQEQVLDLLKEKGLEQVDIACMHGMFDYQLPEIAEHILKHDSSFYLKVVKYFINIGHVHTCVTMDRILPQGSFDRLAHGEEEKKGGIICYLEPNKPGRFEFIENKRAKIFKTVNVRAKDLDKGLEQVSKVADSLVNESHIRIMTTKDNPIVNSLQSFKVRFPFLYWKLEKKDNVENDVKDTFSELIALNTDYTAISITRESVISQVMDCVLKKYELDGRHQSLLTQELKLLL